MTLAREVEEEKRGFCTDHSHEEKRNRLERPFRSLFTDFEFRVTVIAVAGTRATHLGLVHVRYEKMPKNVGVVVD